jgi:hypothetical protein
VLNENKEWWHVQLVQEMVAGVWDTKLERDYRAVDDFETSEGDEDDDGAADW